MRKQVRSIKSKLRFLMFILVGVELVISLSLHLITDISNVQKRLHTQSVLYAELLSEYCIAPMTFNDSAAVFEIIKKSDVIPTILAAAVYTNTEELVSMFSKDSLLTIPHAYIESTKQSELFAPYFIKKQPIVYNDVQLGILCLYISKADIRKSIIYDIRWSFFVSIIITLVGIILIEMFQRKISAPIIQLLETIKIIRSTGNYAIRTQSNTQDEVGQLADNFNELLQQIQKQQKVEIEAKQEIEKLNKELEERVAIRTQQLEQSNKDLESFAYSVSHDLRAPIRHIDGFTKMLENKLTEKNEQIQHYFDKIHESSRNMQNLISDLLSYSRIGRQELEMDFIDMQSVIQQIIDNYEQDLQSRTVEWIINEIPPVYGDIRLLRVAFENLLSNAIKYTSKNDVSRIEIGSTQTEQTIEIYVKDNGVGFDQTYVDKIFGVFQRLHSDKDFQGTGIGLANVKRIIQRHGGSVRAEGVENQGAVFYVTFPKKNV
ncbi:MAG TPA: ATP-binding protein [Bacteroidales bacterium]|nr:ATP-binding protein [Bacteroidales bacterium]